MKKIDNRFGVEKVEDPVDICDLIIRYATEFPLPREIKSRVNMDDLKSTDLDMSRLRIVNKPTCHIANSEGTAGLPNGLPNDDAGLTSSMDKHRKGVKSHILFSSEFTNNTTETQTNHLRTERRTCSSCRISMHKSVTKEGSFTLQISPPGSVIQANGGFRREIHLDKEREKVFEEELVWSLDTEAKTYSLRFLIDFANPMEHVRTRGWSMIFLISLTTLLHSILPPSGVAQLLPLKTRPHYRPHLHHHYHHRSCCRYHHHHHLRCQFFSGLQETRKHFLQQLTTSSLHQPYTQLFVFTSRKGRDLEESIDDCPAC